jgi:hypothetical protein
MVTKIEKRMREELPSEEEMDKNQEVLAEKKKQEEEEKWFDERERAHDRTVGADFGRGRVD